MAKSLPEQITDLLHDDDDDGSGPGGTLRDKGPSHYRGRVQAWDAMEDWMPPHQFVGFLRGNVIKYLCRLDRKGQPLPDAKKALHYMEKLVSYMEEHCGPDGGLC